MKESKLTSMWPAFVVVFLCVRSSKAVPAFSSANPATYCPDLFYSAARVILRSPFLLSNDPSINFPCHSCIADLAAKQSVAPLCFTPNMAMYDPSAPIQRDCHCLTLGLSNTCASICLPNPLCTARDSVKPQCTACVNRVHSFCNNSLPWNTSCYETCQQPSCIKECSSSNYCDARDTICASCVLREPNCNDALSSFAHQWNTACTTSCYGKNCKHECDRRCGDGFATSDEECDDGNVIDSDGCNLSCKVDPNANCEINSNGTSVCKGKNCGNNVIDANEECDDGNSVSGDGCSNMCLQELVCGDGVVASKDEHCDDGNLINGDGCSDNCDIEPGYVCTVNPSGESTCITVCGDGMLVTHEDCDDGNKISNDGCTSDCLIENGFTCQLSAQLNRSVCHAQCGDGIVASSVEECDDGNLESGDGCSSECFIENGYSCTNPAATTNTNNSTTTATAKNSNSNKSECQPICGDGFTRGNETCDDGNSLSNDGCSNHCQVEQGWDCEFTNVRANLSSCTPICGDGLIVGWETCDDSFSDCVNCQHQMVLLGERCGDGIVGGNEVCDDGNNASGDGCSSRCVVETGFRCTTNRNGLSVCSVICGDRIKLPREQCDDGNRVSGDGCSSSCVIERGFRCTSRSRSVSKCSTVCGDGLIRGAESCDDGNGDDGDGCSSSCRIERGFRCPPNQNGVSDCVVACGDGLLYTGEEECDDGNNRDQDGCSDTCVIERGYRCQTQQDPTVCSSICGDGFKTREEECDDGNTSSNDGCSASCKIETRMTQPTNTGTSCGDGIVSSSEQCDDGNTRNGDGCSSRCRVEAFYDCTTQQGGISRCTRSNCINVRSDWYQMQQSQKDDFISCIDQIFASGEYQKFVGIHVYTPNDEYAHHTNGFVAWHRKWLLAVTNLIRTMGGKCKCMNIPYWDWSQDAANMQTNRCRTKEECYPVMREFGGGNTKNRYKTVSIINDPQDTSSPDSTSGYCIVNSITRNWRGNYRLGPYSSDLDASCPIIRRGWSDFDDQAQDGTYYASPMPTASFTNLAAAIARARDYDSFSYVALGDIHVLPHSTSGSILSTFISPADPLFLLHHCNIDRIWALWESCRNCINLSQTQRTTEGRCYISSTPTDGINDVMSFLHFDPISSTRYRIIIADDAAEWSEWFPQNFITPGDVMDISSLGDYAYSYQTNKLVNDLWTASRCEGPRPSMFLRSEIFATELSSDGASAGPSANDQTASNISNSEVVDSGDAIDNYLVWFHEVLDGVHKLLQTLQSTNSIMSVYSKDFAAALGDLDLFAIDTAATCECIHIYEILMNRTIFDDAKNRTEIENGVLIADINAMTKRKWGNEFKIRSCFHRLLDSTEKDRAQRQYCQIILSPTPLLEAAAYVDSLLKELASSVSKDGASSNWFTKIIEFFQGSFSS